MLDVLVPVRNRPHRVEPLLASLRATAPSARVLFIADPDDDAEHAAIRRAGAPFILPGGTYPAKINYGVASTEQPLVFLGADDLEFLPGWLEAARAHIDAGAHVVGINDQIPRRPSRQGHATHFLLTRAYAQLPTIDGGRGPLCEAYRHNYVDDELIGTARHRGVYAYAEAARILHHHPMTGAADDDTYQRGRATFRHDWRIFRRRQPLWT